ncbi:hypothetical protein Vafri_8456 [Volvox africanus]|nr:hypothetical protein Vafri_8456 [Volvox africanus]
MGYCLPLTLVGFKWKWQILQKHRRQSHLSAAEKPPASSINEVAVAESPAPAAAGASMLSLPLPPWSLEPVAAVAEARVSAARTVTSAAESATDSSSLVTATPIMLLVALPPCCCCCCRCCCGGGIGGNSGFVTPSAPSMITSSTSASSPCARFHAAAAIGPIPSTAPRRNSADPAPRVAPTIPGRWLMAM